MTEFRLKFPIRCVASSLTNQSRIICLRDMAKRAHSFEFSTVFGGWMDELLLGELIELELELLLPELLDKLFAGDVADEEEEEYGEDMFKLVGVSWCLELRAIFSISSSMY